MTTPAKAARSAAAPFSLGFRASFNKISDADRYVIYVLWVIGHSATAIAAVTGLPRKRVLNCVNHGQYQNRSGMSDDERKILLDELRSIRFEDGVSIDGGKLDRITWQIQPLAPNKIRTPKRRTP